MDFLVQKLAIFGPGLLGGSLAGAARRRGVAREIRVWGRRREVAEQVAARGWADFASDDVAAVAAGADLIVLATPVGAMPGLARHIVAAKEALAPDVLVTDVGSVKGFVAEKVAPIFDEAGITFIGSHPMAGAETAGFAAARDTLFDGAACFVMQKEGMDTDGHAPSDWWTVAEFWQKLGCREPLSATPDEHDIVVARISHLPHLAASAIALAGVTGWEQYLYAAGQASEDKKQVALKAAGGGFRDTTRVASGDPDLWAEILLENQESVLSALDGLIGYLGNFNKCLKEKNVEKLRRLLREAKKIRDQATTIYKEHNQPHG